MSAPAGFESLIKEVENQIVGIKGNFLQQSEVVTQDSIATLVDLSMGKTDDSNRGEPEGCSDISASNSLEMKSEYFKEGKVVVTKVIQFL